MSKIFISYRRADSKSITLAIRLRLEPERDLHVFQDITNIPDGYDFRTYLREGVAECDVLLVVIGDKWATITDDQGRRRLDNPDDFVRIEVRSGLERRPNCLVLPVLVNGAVPPPEHLLPDDLKPLANLNMRRKVREDDDFEADMGRIIAAIRDFQPGERPAAFQTPDRKPNFNQNQAVADFYEAINEEDWPVAESLLKQIGRYKGGHPGRLSAFDVTDAEHLLKERQLAQTRAEEYDTLRVMARRNPRGLARALESFWRIYPGYDPDDLESKIPPPPPPAGAVPHRPDTLSQGEGVTVPPLHYVARGVGDEVSRLLPAPFAWVGIPGTKGKKWKDQPYQIARYPVTNAQFERFILANGYKEKRWWTTEGWQKCQEGWHYDGWWKPSGKPWTQPRYWDDDNFNSADQPVVGVSWFEAVAFCLWLSDATKEKIMLPTKDQWQYAAQGDDGRDYPWGNKWEGSRCNNRADFRGIDKTTPVTFYEGQGDSFFGVVDMAGNVWEWCLTDFYYNTNDINSNAALRVLRGGSWYYGDTIIFRCDNHNRDYPHSGDAGYGFRVSRS